jgi:PHD/YefM family antitoxin component YafN of YafNO toxin-antitoxin module
MERIISVTDLVRNAARIAEEIETEGTIYKITRNGRGSMVLVDHEYFDAWMHAIDEMRRPDWREVWERTTRDIAAGRGRDLEDIAKELGFDRPPHTRRGKAAARAPSARRKQSRPRTAGARGRTSKR